MLTVDFSTGGDGIVTTDAIQAVADRKGKKLGAEEGSSTHFLLLNVLADAGMNLQDIDLQPMRADDPRPQFAERQGASWGADRRGFREPAATDEVVMANSAGVGRDSPLPRRRTRLHSHHSRRECAATPGGHGLTG